MDDKHTQNVSNRQNKARVHSLTHAIVSLKSHSNAEYKGLKTLIRCLYIDYIVKTSRYMNKSLCTARDYSISEIMTWTNKWERNVTK